MAAGAPEVGVAPRFQVTPAHPFIRRAGAQQGSSGLPLQELSASRCSLPHLVSGLQITGDEAASLLPTEQRDLGIAGSLGYPSSWNAPPSRLLAAKQGTSRRRVQGDRGFARRLLCRAGAMSPWTPGSEQIVQRQISFGTVVSRAADGGQGSKSSVTQPVLGWPSALAVSGLSPRIEVLPQLLSLCSPL